LSIRNAYYLDRNKIRITNPSWEASLQALVTTIAMSMNGGGGQARATLDKLVLYDQEGFYKSHRDGEKEPGHFGTTVSDCDYEKKGFSLIDPPAASTHHHLPLRVS